METNLGKLLDAHGLTLEEEVFYGNFAEIELCDLCGDYLGIFNYHEDTKFIVYNGIQFLCPKCRS